MDDTELHPRVQALVDKLRSHVPLPKDGLDELLKKIFGPDPPGPSGLGKLLFLSSLEIAYLQSYNELGEQAEAAEKLMHFDESLCWASRMNAALRGDPIRVLHLVTHNALRCHDSDVEVYFFLGAGCQERLEARVGADPYAVNQINEPPEPDGTNNFDRSDTGEDLGFKTLYDTCALHDLARHVDRLLEECGSPRRLYCAGSWGKPGELPHDQYWLTSQSVAAELEALGFAMKRATEVFDRDEASISWDTGRFDPDDPWA